MDSSSHPVMSICNLITPTSSETPSVNLVTPTTSQVVCARACDHSRYVYDATQCETSLPVTTVDQDDGNNEISSSPIEAETRDEIIPATPAATPSNLPRSHLPAEVIDLVRETDTSSCSSSIVSVPVIPVPRNRVPVPLAPVNLRTTMFSSQFKFDASRGVYKITKNLSAKYLWAPDELPRYFPTAPDGYATVVSIAKEGLFSHDPSGATLSLMGVSDREFSDRVKSGGPYSTVVQKDGNSSVMFAGERFTVNRHKSDCSGIKSCSCSMRKNSVPHAGYQAPDAAAASNEVDQYETCEDEAEMKKARDTFFYAQVHFPMHCKHVGYITCEDDM